MVIWENESIQVEIIRVDLSFPSSFKYQALVWSCKLLVLPPLYMNCLLILFLEKKDWHVFMNYSADFIPMIIFRICDFIFSRLSYWSSNHFILLCCLFYFSGATSASSIVHTSTCKQETTLQLIHLGPLYYFYTITADVWLCHQMMNKWILCVV